MKQLDLAWAAGFFDGEGHTALKGRQATSFQVAQKDPECLERLQKIFWGAGSIGGPYHQKNPVYFWYLCRTELVDKALNLMWPYLSSSKKKQAEKCGFIFGKVRIPKTGRPVNEKRTIPSCGHPNRVHVALGKCRDCYHHDRYKETGKP